MEYKAKVAVLFRNYGPYHFARVSCFHQRCLSDNIQCVGIELARSEATYAWVTATDQVGYPFVSIVPDRQLEQVKWHDLMRHTFATLDQENPSIVAIAGYSSPGMLAALAWCRWRGKAAILMSDSKADDAERHWLSEQVKRGLLKQYRAAIVAGKPQLRYLIHLGMSAHQIFLGYDVVDNAVFHPDQIGRLPRPLQRPFFLSINRFIARKNLSNLVAAYAVYYQRMGAKAWDLVLCGDGELRSQIEQQANELGVRDRIHFSGFLQQDELMPYFAHANCFIHASYQEQWGLVVNEAMAAGLPVLVSNRCGCFEDLIIEGVNGWGFDPNSVEQMQQLMSKMSSNEEYTKAMGTAALAHIQNFSPSYFAQGLYQAVEHVLKGG